MTIYDINYIYNIYIYVYVDLGFVTDTLRKWNQNAAATPMFEFTRFVTMPLTLKVAPLKAFSFCARLTSLSKELGEDSFGAEIPQEDWWNMSLTLFLATLRCPNCRSSVSSVSGYPPKTNTAPHRQVWKMIFLFYQWDMLVSGSVILSQELPIPVVLLGFSKGGAVGDPQLLWQLHPQRSMLMADIRASQLRALVYPISYMDFMSFPDPWCRISAICGNIYQVL